MIKMANIVICVNIMNGDFSYHIDSVWTSARKAQKRCDELNSEGKAKWREEFGYGIFIIEREFISK